jgi:protein-S-isoprenylcysteine O-methyltransferase Ste14
MRRMSGTRVPSLGPRGEGWVVGQGLLLLGIAGLGLPGLGALPPDSGVGWARVLLGLAVMAGGLAIGGLALRDLGASLTALPHPRADASFVDSGIYAVIRHPMYAALIATSLGWVLVTASVPAALATVALAAWLDLKSRREEAWLRGHYPEYEAYRRRTHRFIPGAY